MESTYFFPFLANTVGVYQKDIAKRYYNLVLVMWQCLYSDLNKGKSVYLLYSMTQRCCLLHLIKQNYLLKSFLRTLILMTRVSLYLFSPFRTNLKLHNIFITPKMVQNVIINLERCLVLIVSQWLF